MGKVYRDEVRCCDGCYETPREKDVQRFGTSVAKLSRNGRKAMRKSRNASQGRKLSVPRENGVGAAPGNYIESFEYGQLPLDIARPIWYHMFVEGH